MAAAARKLTADQLHERIRKLEERANVEAFVVLDSQGHHIGTIRFHLPHNGEGKLTCSAADWTVPTPADEATLEKWTRWQLGWATGYDKHTAAMSGMTIGDVKIEDRGARWDSQLRAAGYNVIQGV